MIIAVYNVSTPYSFTYADLYFNLSAIETVLSLYLSLCPLLPVKGHQRPVNCSVLIQDDIVISIWAVDLIVETNAAHQLD